MKKSILHLGCLLAVSVLVVLFWWRNRLENSQDVPIRAAAQRYGLEPALVKAVVWRESRFLPDVHGNAGELGLMLLQVPAA